MGARRLMDGESVAYTAKLHWRLLVPAASGFLLLLAAGLAGIMALDFKGDVLLLFPTVIPLIFLFKKAFERWSSTFAVTNKRVMVRQGVLAVKSFEIMIEKIESVTTEQTLAGRLWDCGLVMIGTAGGSLSFPNIQHPHLFRQKIQEQMASGIRK